MRWRYMALLLLPVLCHEGCAHRRPVYLGTRELPAEWRTRAEQTDYTETGRYDEVAELCRRMVAFSPDARYTSFGQSGEGRALPLLVLSTERAFTPEAAHRSRRPIVLIQNAIHAGECEGKDACLELAREMLVTGQLAELLEHVTLLIIPVFNVDGHERFGPYNRANQNGPREMGWRTTAVNLNLNREYVKADAVEMQAWLRLWNAWQPDLLIDTHTTNGSDHRYDVFYTAITHQGAAEPVAAWIIDVLYPGIVPPLAAAGVETLPYCWPRDRKDVAAGLAGSVDFSPRYSTGYGALCNRPALLIETHMLKPYGRRVQATREMLVQVLKTVNRQPAALRDAVRAADELCTRTRGGHYDGRVPLRVELTGESHPVVYKGFVPRVRTSDITGGEIVDYTDTPIDIATQMYDQTNVTVSVVPPAAYLIPPQWTEVVARLEWHGVRCGRLTQPVRLPVESYRFEDVRFEATPSEGRQIPHYRAEPVREEREFAAGTIIVPLDQPRAKLAVHMLEPEAPDALVAWGLFNTIFERKEYAESYVMEPIARQMLAADPALRQEFEQRLATDEAFAASARQRLDFFYRKSPYWDARHCVYPVARLVDGDRLTALTVR